MNFHDKPNTYVGEVHLFVVDLERSIDFYKKLLGFRILEQTEEIVVFSANGKTPLVTVEKLKNSAPKERRTTGLYHYALLLPERLDLAKVLQRLLQAGYPLQGAADHLVSEALYLADPDGHGIEIYIDRPSESWQWLNGEVNMTSDPLDAEGLLAIGQGKSWNGMPADTIMGHIHLHVSELKQIREFYTQGLGFEVVNSKYGDQVLFISSGGYHHHIGLNTWNGVGAPPPAENNISMKQFSLVFPSEEARKEAINRLKTIGATVFEKDNAIHVKDPSGNEIELNIKND